MATYVIRRLAFLGAVLLGVSLVVFVVANALPSDPAVAALGIHATQEQIDHLRRQLGLDRPVLQRYLAFLGRLLRGDLGESIMTRRPVAADLAEFYPATIELAGWSMALSLVVGIPLGVVSAARPGSILDHGTRLLAIGGAALPIFWLGLMLQLVFYGKLGWLPPGDRLTPGALPGQITGILSLDALLMLEPAGLADVLRHLALPVLSLSGLTTAIIARMTRSAMLEVLREPFISAARARGVAEGAILWRHALKNAGIPVATVAGLRFGHLLAGAVFTETIFAWPGVGRYAVQAVLNNDFPVVTGFTLTITAFYALINLAVDLLLTWLDPRVRT